MPIYLASWEAPVWLRASSLGRSRYNSEDLSSGDSMSFAFVFPGQGSQSLGMLAALAQSDPVVRATFDEASAVLGYDLWNLIQQGPKERLDSTEGTQPALLAAGGGTWGPWDK